MATVKNLFIEFQHGRTLIFDEPHPGATVDTTKADRSKLHNLVLNTREIAKTVGISCVISS